MGSCLSKKTTTTTSGALPDPTNLNTESVKKKNPEKETVKKEIFIIKHRKSHEIDRRSEDEQKGKFNQKLNSCTTSTASEAFEIVNNGGISTSSNGGGTVRTSSSCTKEELDAILIQCGHLSRSSSTGKYSGSKRSFDFDHDNNFIGGGDDDEAALDKIHRHRRESRGSPSPSRRRRRTLSRERDNHHHHHLHSGGGGGGGRRVSRSPGKRSESLISNSNSTTGGGGGRSSNRPEKMVAVPATVSSSMVMEKRNNGDENDGLPVDAIRRITVKRNVYVGDKEMGLRARSQSPGKGKVRVWSENQNGNTNEKQQHPLMLSRSNSRKNEQSPYRRNNALREIDQNSLGFQHLELGSNNSLSQAILKPNIETARTNIIVERIENKTCISNCKPKEQHIIVEEAVGVPPITRDITMTEITSGDQTLKPQTLTRTRSSRRSRDLDINFEALLNPTPSYNSLLLEDIHNFHQNNTPFSLPPCLTKACSILEAVADLNSTTSSNMSGTFSDDRNINPTSEKFSFGSNLSGKNRLGKKDPFVESEVGVNDDLMEPSFHNYVTLRRGQVGELDMEEEESSGSNSFLGGPQNSADPTDRWTSLKSIAREENWDPLGIQRSAFSESGQRKVIVKQQSGIGRGKVGSFRNLNTLQTEATASP